MKQQVAHSLEFYGFISWNDTTSSELALSVIQWMCTWNPTTVNCPALHPILVVYSLVTLLYASSLVVEQLRTEVHYHVLYGCFYWTTA